MTSYRRDQATRCARCEAATEKEELTFTLDGEALCPACSARHESALAHASHQRHGMVRWCPRCKAPTALREEPERHVEVVRGKAHVYFAPTTQIHCGRCKVSVSILSFFGVFLLGIGGLIGAFILSVTALPTWAVIALAALIPGIVLAREISVRFSFRRLPAPD